VIIGIISGPRKFIGIKPRTADAFERFTVCVVGYHPTIADLKRGISKALRKKARYNPIGRVDIFLGKKKLDDDKLLSYYNIKHGSASGIECVLQDDTMASDSESSIQDS
jgi:hypothetical protein